MVERLNTDVSNTSIYLNTKHMEDCNQLTDKHNILYIPKLKVDTCTLKRDTDRVSFTIKLNKYIV